METKAITIKNLNIETISLLTEMRKLERRQLCVILEDAIEQYWQDNYEDG